MAMQRFFRHNKNIIISLLAFFLLLAAAPETLQAQKLPELIPYRKGDKWGYADSTGKIVIAPTYDGVSFFRYDIAIVGMNTGHSCIINKKGDTLYSVYGGLSFGEDSTLKFLDFHDTEPKYKYRNFHKFR